MWANVVAIAMCVLTSACAHQQRATSASDGGSLPAEFERVLRDYEAGWRAKDAKALAALFAKDGFVLPNGRPPVRGRAEIQKNYEGSGGPLHLRALAWARSGGIGYIIGEYAPTPDFANPGKFTLTLVWDARDASGSRWLIMSDMDNGNSRPPRPQ